jgi:hypothetical protein
MEKFIERQNIAHYEDQLKTESDSVKRAMLERLLAEEKVKQASRPSVEKK